MINKIILFCLISMIALQGCVVVGIGKRPYYSQNNFGEDEKQIKNSTELDPHIRLSGKEKNLYLPFFLIVWETNNYGVSFNIFSSENKFKSIDSIKYTITNLNESILSAGKYNIVQPFLKYEYNNGAIISYEAKIATNCNIKIPKREKVNNLKIYFTLYLKDQTDHLVVHKYYYKLERKQEKWITVGLFQV